MAESLMGRVASWCFNRHLHECFTVRLNQWEVDVRLEHDGLYRENLLIEQWEKDNDLLVSLLTGEAEILG
jgi:hypothetical protein